MLLHTHKPNAPLSLHVEQLWQLHDAPPHVSERVLPTGTLEMVFDLAQDGVSIESAGGSQRLSGALVSGVYRRYFAIDTKNHADIVGVHFKPGGAWGVLGVAPGELTDRHVDLADLWGSSCVFSLREWLMETPRQQRLAALDTYLTMRCSSHQLHPACAGALERLRRGAPVADVARAVGLSARRLQALFREQVGTTPKHFARICRFQRALSGLSSGEAGPQLALSAGYCDQSHLIREFQALAGCAPIALTRAQSIAVKQHHVAVAPAFRNVQSL